MPTPGDCVPPAREGVDRPLVEGRAEGVEVGVGDTEQLAGTGRPGVVHALGQGQGWQAAADTAPVALLNLPAGQGCAK